MLSANIYFEYINTRYVPSLTFVFHSQLVKGRGREECPLGFFLTEVLRAYVATTSESRFFLTHEPMIKRLFDEVEPSHLLFSRFQYFNVFAQIRKTTRHKFFFDYRISEFQESRELVNYFQYSQPFNRFSLPVGRGPGAAERKAGTTKEMLGVGSLRIPTTSNVFGTNSWHGGGPTLTFTRMMRDVAKRGSALRKNVIRRVMRMPDVWHTQYGNVSDILEGAEMGETRGFAYTTMVYGDTFVNYLPAFISRFEEVVKKKNLLIFTFDEQCLQKCKEVGYTGCVEGGTPGILQKFTIPWVLTTLGIDTVWMDFDVYFVQNPTPYIIEHANRPIRKWENDLVLDTSSESSGSAAGPLKDPYVQSQRPSGYEILISGSFASPCICNGFVFFKATRHVILWLVDVIHWMYDHPYEHDQKCFSGWLNYTEPISFTPLPRSGPLPRWDTLDPIKRFVTAAVVEGNGWMADSWEEVVMFHFLHGDSDKGGELDSNIKFNYTIELLDSKTNSKVQ